MDPRFVEKKNSAPLAIAHMPAVMALLAPTDVIVTNIPTLSIYDLGTSRLMRVVLIPGWNESGKGMPVFEGAEPGERAG
jgi:hypothetical protein